MLEQHAYPNARMYVHRRRSTLTPSSPAWTDRAKELPGLTGLGQPSWCWFVYVWHPLRAAADQVVIRGRDERGFSGCVGHVKEGWPEPATPTPRTSHRQYCCHTYHHSTILAHAGRVPDRKVVCLASGAKIRDRFERRKTDRPSE